MDSPLTYLFGFCLLVNICSCQLYPEDSTLRHLARDKHKRIVDQPAAMNFYAYSPAKTAQDCAKQCYERMNFCFSARFDLNKEEQVGRCSFSYYRQLNCDITNTTELGGILRKSEVLLCVKCGTTPPPVIDQNRLPGDIKPTEFFEQKDHHNVTVNKTHQDIPVPKTLPVGSVTLLTLNLTANTTAGSLLTSETSESSSTIILSSPITTASAAVVNQTNVTTVTVDVISSTIVSSTVESISTTVPTVHLTTEAVSEVSTSAPAATTDSTDKMAAKSDLTESNTTTVQANSSSLIKDLMNSTMVNCPTCRSNLTSAAQNSSEVDLALHSNLGKISHGVMETLRNYIDSLNATQNNTTAQNIPLTTDSKTLANLNGTTSTTPGGLKTELSTPLMTTSEIRVATTSTEIANVSTTAAVVTTDQTTTAEPTTTTVAAGWYQLPACQGNFTYEVKKAAGNQELKWYYKVGAATLHDCASSCFRLPFCVSASYQDHVCYFSYARHDCKSFTTEKFDEGMPATIYCLQCS